MVQYTSSHLAPWILVEGNDKRYARVKALQTVSDQLEKAIEDKDGSAATRDDAADAARRESEEHAV